MPQGCIRITDSDICDCGHATRRPLRFRSQAVKFPRVRAYNESDRKYRSTTSTSISISKPSGGVADGDAATHPAARTGTALRARRRPSRPFRLAAGRASWAPPPRTTQACAHARPDPDRPACGGASSGAAAYRSRPGGFAPFLAPHRPEPGDLKLSGTRLVVGPRCPGRRAARSGRRPRTIPNGPRSRAATASCPSRAARRARRCSRIRWLLPGRTTHPARQPRDRRLIGQTLTAARAKRRVAADSVVADGYYLAGLRGRVLASRATGG